MHFSCSYLVLPVMGLTAFSPRSGMLPKKLRFPRISCLKLDRSGSSFTAVAAAAGFVAAGLTGVFLSLDVAIVSCILLGTGVGGEVMTHATRWMLAANRKAYSEKRGVRRRMRAV